MTPELRENGWGDPHPAYACPVCKTDYWIIDGKPSRFPPGYLILKVPDKDTDIKEEYAEYNRNWSI